MSSSSSEEEELSRVRSITSAFLVVLGSVEWGTTEDCRKGAVAKGQKFKDKAGIILHCPVVHKQKTNPLKRPKSTTCLSLGTFELPVF